MSTTYGYLYDKNGRYLETIPIQEIPIMGIEIEYRTEEREVRDPDMLCQIHQDFEDGKSEEAPLFSKHECPDCVIGLLRYETVTVPYEVEMPIGWKPDIPENCTLEPPIYTDATWDGTKWIYDRDINPPEPTEPENPQTPEEVIRDILLDKILKLEARTLALETRFAELESDFKSSIVSGGGTVEKEPMNPEDLPTFEPPQNETPEPKQDLLALYQDPSVGKE
ncbi:hypothetical protein [Bacillus cereus]|uniref:hypothetical protein n=1 Tax=Bacillus cereus group TaxID=86661 RepID=UPI001BA9575F|nr:hypothetical protein [Bacillus cereus]MBR9655794.1 hypothetical protein [Bacillus cereus]